MDNPSPVNVFTVDLEDWFQGLTSTNPQVDRPRKSRRVPAVVATDLDFEDDISILSDSIEKAQELLRSVIRECKRTGLTLNAKEQV